MEKQTMIKNNIVDNFSKYKEIEELYDFEKIMNDNILENLSHNITHKELEVSINEDISKVNNHINALILEEQKALLKKNKASSMISTQNEYAKNQIQLGNDENAKMALHKKREYISNYNKEHSLYLNIRYIKHKLELIKDKYLKDLCLINDINEKVFLFDYYDYKFKTEYVEDYIAPNVIPVLDELKILKQKYSVENEDNLFNNTPNDDFIEVEETEEKLK